MKLEESELQIVKSILSEYLPSFEVRAFGSRVTEKNLKPFSDLDLAVMTKEPLEIETFGKVKDAFSESNLTIKVDLVDWASISSDFQKIIAGKYEVIQEAV